MDANEPETGLLLREAWVVSERSEGDCGATLQRSTRGFTAAAAG